MEDRWVEFRRYGWLHEAQLVVSLLEAHEIDAFLPDEHTMGVHPGLALIASGVRIFVHESDLERARAVLADAGTDALPEGPDR